MALFLERYLKELQDDEPDIKALVAGVSTRSLHTNPMDLLRTLMRMIKNFFQLDAPALPEKESEILSHGCLFAWLQQGVSQGPITLGLDLDGFQDAPGGGSQPSDVEAASMRWLTSAQPSRSNLIVTTAQPSAVETVKERYHWPVLLMEPVKLDEALAIVEAYLGKRGLEFVGKSSEKLNMFRPEDLGNPLFLTTLLLEWRTLDHIGYKFS